MMTSKKLRGVPESTFKMCPVCFSLEAGPKPETMDEAIEKLKADNKRLRERLRDITYDDYDGVDALRGRWPTTYGVRSAYYQADANTWPLNLPDNYRGRILLNVSYGGGSQYEGVQYVDTYEYAEEVADRLQILLDKPFPGFHWRMGTFFNVAPDGQIEIIRRPSTQHFPIMLARIPPLEWKSIVDFVARGEQVIKAASPRPTGDVVGQAVELLARLEEIGGNKAGAFTLRNVGAVGSVFEAKLEAALATLQPADPKASSDVVTVATRAVRYALRDIKDDLTEQGEK